jgi:predicted lysophospholipase L1 biosynthesis ABC-type transport system permease subunit
LARLQWPEENPLGKPFAMGVNAAGADVDATVVGVCGSARLVSPEDSDAVEVYQLARGDALPSVTVLVRTAGAPEGVLPSVGSIAKDIDSQLFPEIRLMAASYREKVRASEYAALSASLLGLTALLIACLGIVGLVAYGVSQRTREIGIRMALGAPPSHVLSVVLRQLSRPVAGGLLLGVGGAAALSQVLRGVLYGVSNLDATAYLAAVGIFAFTAAAAALWPARRALRIDPMLALRCD